MPLFSLSSAKCTKKHKFSHFLLALLLGGRFLRFFAIFFEKVAFCSGYFLGKKSPIFPILSIFRICKNVHIFHKFRKKMRFCPRKILCTFVFFEDFSSENYSQISVFCAETPFLFFCDFVYTDFAFSNLALFGLGKPGEITCFFRNFCYKKKHEITK